MKKRKELSHMNTQFEIEYEYPDSCPICNNMGRPMELYCKIGDYEDAYCDKLITLYKCHMCGDSFLIQHQVDVYSAYNSLQLYHADMVYITPQNSATRDFSKRLQDVSPRFREVVRQSDEAAAAGLTEISGMGYRKALEILILDFIKYITPEKLAALEKTALRNCIKDHLPADAESLKQAADDCAILGNEEAHYFNRTQPQDDINVKSLLTASIHWVEMYLMTHRSERL